MRGAGRLGAGRPWRAEELEGAFAEYARCKDECSRTGDWRPYARLFTQDARVVEHAYGEFKGRATIEDYIVRVMEPFPHMTFPMYVEQYQLLARLAVYLADGLTD